MTAEPVHVAAAAVLNAANEVLISRRQHGTHLAGFWEFPGGKLETGESVTAALARELDEELGITPAAFRPLIRVRHDYPEKSVLLDVWRVDAYSGEPVAREMQEMRWQPVDRLDVNEFPAADLPVIKALNLPSQLMITGSFVDAVDFMARLEKALKHGLKQVQLRLKSHWLEQHSDRAMLELVEGAAAACRARDATLMLNLPATVLPMALEAAGETAGVHLDSRALAKTTARPGAARFSVSCHTFDELNKARLLDADYALLSPVQYTRSHPDTDPLGWQRFSEMIEHIAMPVYALGGVGADDLEAAWAAGAQGVAAISAFWEPEG